MRWTLHLAELPGNYCDPPFLGETAKRLARRLKLRAVVMDEGKIKKIGMRALWAVGKGSARPSPLHRIATRRRRQKRPARARRQRRDFRHRRHLAQTRRGDGRNEIRYVRRGRGFRRARRLRASQFAAQCRRA